EAGRAAGAGLVGGALPLEVAALLEAGAERETATATVSLRRQHLVHLGAVRLELERRRGHVEPPDAGPGAAGVGHARVPVRLEVRDPRPQGERVVLPQRLHVPSLEPGALDR